MNYSPDALAVRKLDWDFFITLTHAGAGWIRDKKDGGKRLKGSEVQRRFEVPSRSQQQRRFQAYIYKVCRAFKVKPRNLEWVSRLEVGKGGRDHFHVLMRLPSRSRCSVKSSKHRLQNIWFSKLEYGIANVRVVDSNQGVAGYIAKAVNEYEQNRFTNEQYRQVTFSSAAIRAMT